MSVAILNATRPKRVTDRVTLYLPGQCRVEVEAHPSGAILVSVWDAKGPVTSERLSPNEVEDMLAGIGAILDGE